jgi:hypothetical protein
MKSLFYLSLFSPIVIFASAEYDIIRSSSSRELLATGRVLRGALLETTTEIDPSKIDRSFGEKELLVIRIQAADSSTTATKAQLFQDIFDDKANLSKQLKACSHGKLTMKPATGRNIDNGVTTIQLNSVVGRTTQAIINEIDSDATSLFGRALNQFDHVMMCMPPGTMFLNGKGQNTDGWHAYVPGDHRYASFMSVYNDQWCSSVSAGMHEIGHNLGLDHANELGSSYEDETGQMGYSGIRESFGALRCYNPAKSWQLGWYSEHSRRINPFIDAPFETTLTGITMNFETDDKSRNALLQIPNGNKDLYIGYNLANEFNSGTIEGENKVLINEQEFGGHKDSNLLAKLAKNDSYTIKDYQGSGKNLIISVTDKISNGKEVRLRVYFEISQERNISNQARGCRDDQVRFEVSVQTDDYAGDTSWELIDNGSNAIVASRSEGSFQNDESYEDLVCIDRVKDFTFTLFDSYKDGICCTYGWGAYSIFLDGEQIFQGGEFKSASVSHTFRTKQQDKSNSNASCQDDPLFRYRGKKCNWVEKDAENRCKMDWKGKPIKNSCPMACGMCNNTNGVINPKRTNNIFCRDDANYRYRGRKSCDWVAEKADQRCGRKWRGKLVSEQCKSSCNSCGSGTTK